MDASFEHCRLSRQGILLMSELYWSVIMSETDGIAAALRAEVLLIPVFL